MAPRYNTQHHLWFKLNTQPPAAAVRYMCSQASSTNHTPPSASSAHRGATTLRLPSCGGQKSDAVSQRESTSSPFRPPCLSTWRVELLYAHVPMLVRHPSAPRQVRALRAKAQEQGVWRGNARARTQSKTHKARTHTPPSHDTLVFDPLVLQPRGKATALLIHKCNYDSLTLCIWCRIAI